MQRAYSIYFPLKRDGILLAGQVVRLKVCVCRETQSGRLKELNITTGIEGDRLAKHIW